MPEFHDKEKVLFQNLKDAGCPKELIEQCILLYENKDSKKLTGQLSHHRKVLLGDLHQIQEEIDCLDYLLYRLKNEEEEL